MSDYEFRQIYNVAQECGCEISNECTLEKQLERLQAAKNWFNTNFGDIFEVVEPVKTNNQNEYALYVYFKGTKCGLYLKYRDSYNVTGTNMGYVRNGTATFVTASYGNVGELGLATLNLILIKSKYGIIAGFFKDDLSAVRGGAFISDSGFVSVLVDTTSNVYISNGLNDAITTGQMRTSNIDGVWLAKGIPATVTSPVECYFNYGERVANCRTYSVEGDSTESKFAEIGSFDGRVAYALKLEEPTAEDYSGLTPFWNVSDEGAV